MSPGPSGAHLWHVEGEGRHPRSFALRRSQRRPYGCALGNDAAQGHAHDQIHRRMISSQGC
eukprot:222094-Alexandrium_andersonii.AAC.1